MDLDDVPCKHGSARGATWEGAGRAKGVEGVEEDGLVDVVGDVADEDGFLGLGSFLHRWVW